MSLKMASVLPGHSAGVPTAVLNACENQMYNKPLGYFLTFTIHGSWLHGDERGSFLRGGKYIADDWDLYRQKIMSLKDDLHLLSNEHREVIENAIREICRKRQWQIHELNVRTNHVHVVVAVNDVKPEKIMADMKARATFRMRKAGYLAADQKLWSEHGSTVYLFTENNFSLASEYVRDCQ